MVEASFVQVAFAARDEVPETSPHAENDQDEAPPKPHIEQAFDLLDKNHDSLLGEEEFLQGSIGKAGEAKREDFREFDVDEDGSLSLGEFKRRGRKPGGYSPPTGAVVLQKYDMDRDGTLSLEEFRLSRTGHGRTWATGSFYGWDSNEDGQLEAGEIDERGEGCTITPAGLFRQRDHDEDGFLTIEEYALGRLESIDAQWCVDQFASVDEDQDELLTFDEFRFSAKAELPPEEMFAGRDMNADGLLSPVELVRFMRLKQARGARRRFAEFDLSGDGFYTFGEYLTREETLADEQYRREHGEPWEWWIKAIIALDVLVAAWFVSLFMKRWRRARLQGEPAFPVPQTIDELQVE